jgi:hypothetical protein
MKEALLALTLVSGAAFAGDAELLRCLNAGDKEARLVCYDALATAVRDAQPAAAAVASAEAKFQATQNFGRSAQQRASTALDVMESEITGNFGGWSQGERVRLANGQVWQILEKGTSFQVLNNPKVKIRPGMMGSYFMEIDGVSFQIKVRRAQ